MSGSFELIRPLSGANFGGRLSLVGDGDAHAFVMAAERDPAALPRALADSGGLLVLHGMDAMADAPELLVRLSRIFGPEVENYRQTLTPLNMVHETVPEIFIVSNTPPASRQPPRRPDPPLTADGKLPVQFPHRRGWHTDQSYRRPPPDISLFLAVVPVPQDQGQTLFADGTAAYEALPARRLQARVDGSCKAFTPAPAPNARAMRCSQASRHARCSPTNCRSANQSCGYTRSPAAARCICASSAKWTGWKGHLSACSQARTVTAPSCCSN